MRPFVTEDLTAISVSPWIPLDWETTPFNVGLAVEIDNTPTLVAKVQYTMINPNKATPAASQIFDDATLVTLAASTLGSTTIPVYAARLNVTSWTAGNARLRVMQGDDT